MDDHTNQYQPNAPGEPTAANLLTPKELELCQFLLMGCANHQVAEFADVSVRTIENRRRSIHDKLQVRNAVQLGAELARLGVKADEASKLYNS